jgi:hypothetical protein
MLEIVMVIIVLFLLGIIKLEKTPSSITYCDCQHHPQEEDSDEFIDGLITGYLLS